MSIDVTFEEIEQTALKFALAEFKGVCQLTTLLLLWP